MEVVEKYKKLPGRGARRAGPVMMSRIMSRLYLGSDHLLCVDTEGGINEKYRRFYFKDIQSIVVTRVKRNAIMVVCTLLALGGAGIAAVSFTEAVLGMRIFIWFVALFPIMPLVFELWRGPRCNSVLKTAVQVIELPSLARVRTANKVLAQIRPNIEAAQGILPREQVMQQLGLAPIPAPPVIEPASPPPPVDAEPSSEPPNA